MPMSLAQVLAHPVVRRGAPAILAGGDRLDRPVRWVHSSDIFEIAPLMRPDDLLLTTGLGLEGRPAEASREFVRSLAQRGVAGLVLETCRFFDAAPAAMVAEAERVGLPLVGFDAVVPFVEVTEAVNASLVDEAVHRLRHADEVSRALSEVLVSGGGVPETLARLEILLGGPVRLVRTSTDMPDDPGPDPSGGGDPVGGSGADAELPDAVPVLVHGAVAGWLRTRLPTEDRSLADAALERAAAALSLALLRDERSTASPMAARRHLAGLLLSGADDPAAVRGAARAAGLPATARAYVVVVASGADLDRVAAMVDRAGSAAAGPGRTVAASSAGQPLVAGIVVGTTSPRQLAGRVAQELREVTAGVPRAIAAVGPGCATLGAVAAAAAEARLALRAVWAAAPRSRVVEAAAVGAERALLRGHDALALEALVAEHLGPVVAYDAARGTRLVETLTAVLESADSKADVARRLHVQRQTLYQRLARVEELLGVAVDDVGVRAGLVLALHAQRLVAAGLADV